VLQFIEQQRARALAAGTSADVLRVRAQVLEQSLEAAEQATGFFSLTVPTGGGKTLASLAFALRHAAEHDLRRVVVIAPFLAIIEQNADVIRTALGPSAEDLVLEHHSQADESRTNDEQSLAELRRQMLAENWDTPLVVTTAVQFFESLFSNRPGRVRKLHNIARSALIFDEAQTFPPGLLRPIVGMLEQLVAEYSCTVLFATATQPALAHPRLREPLLRNVMREIVADPGDLFGRLKRVEVDWSAATVGSSMDAVAGEMASEHQALAIVNTKQQARELFEALRRYDIDAEHLSGRMCPAHRLEVLARVRVSLENGQRCLVSSTSGLEAGVDISFPKVWRALAPFDSIAQAAGRCNREGRLQSGRLIVFEPEDGKTPQGVYETGRNVTRNLLRMQLSIDDPDSFALYFAHLYNMTSLDEHHVIRLREQLEFPAVAERVRLIAEDTVPVLVAFGEGLSMIDRFVKGEVHALDRYQRRRLERYSVSLYRPEFEQAKAAGFIYEAAGIWYAPSNYSPQLGLTFEDGILIE
jgi:CRISPR-associated endonuclease/helicase Cas3